MRLAPSNRHAIPKWGANHWSSSPFQGFARQVPSFLFLFLVGQTLVRPLLTFLFMALPDQLLERKKEGTSIHQPNGRKKDTAGEYKAGP